MPGRAESKGSKTPTRAHTIAEFDAWRSRQEVAAKSRSSRAQGGMAAPAGAASGGGGGAPYHHHRRTSAGGSGGAAAAKMPLLPLTKGPSPELSTRIRPTAPPAEARIPATTYGHDGSGSGDGGGGGGGGGGGSGGVPIGLKVGVFGGGAMTTPEGRGTGASSSDHDRRMSTRTEDRMDDRMDNRMGGRMENRMGDQMGDHVEDRMGDQIDGRMGDQMENRPQNRMVSSSPADADLSAFGFPFEGREATVSRGRGTGNGIGEDCSPAWSSRFRGDSDDEVRVEEREGSGHGDVGGGEEREEEAGLRGELEVFASHLRQEFELKLLVTARKGLREASQRATRAGRLRLDAHKSESGREIRRLEEEGRSLREHAARLETANLALAAKTQVLGERLSAIHARTSRGSVVARCLSTWRANATRARRERSKSEAATAHARRKLMSSTLVAWRDEARLRVATRGKKAADQKLHAITKEIIGRYEAELSSTRTALDDANKQIVLEKARQREMEEGMRRTLLRGMSAMNLEAMHLMTGASRDAGEELLGASGGSSGGVSSSRYSAYTSRAAPPASALSRPSTGHHRLLEECPRPLAPPRPATPASR